MKPGGRTVGVAVTLLGIATIVAAGFALREKALEQWYIWKLESKDFVVKYRAAIGLARLGSRKAVPRLVKLLKESYGHDREALAARGARPTNVADGDLMVSVFQEIGRPAVPALVQALREETPLWVDQSFWRVRACRSLEWIRARESVLPLADLLEDKDCRVRLAACLALAAMGPDAREAVPALTRVVNAKAVTSAAAAKALKEIQGHAPPGVVPDIPHDAPDNLKTSDHAESPR